MITGSILNAHQNTRWKNFVNTQINQTYLLMEGITHTQYLRAKQLAQQRQKRFKHQTKVKVAPGTWIYVPKKIAHSKKKLRAFLEKRQERLQQKARLENQLKRDRQQRSKTTYHANRNQQQAKIKKMVDGS